MRRSAGSEPVGFGHPPLRPGEGPAHRCAPKSHSPLPAMGDGWGVLTALLLAGAERRETWTPHGRSYLSLTLTSLQGETPMAARTFFTIPTGSSHRLSELSIGTIGFVTSIFSGTAT